MGFSSKHSCRIKAGKLFHINGVPRAIRGDDVEALYPKGFASWVGQNLQKEEDWKEPRWVWYGSAEVPEEMLGAGSQSVDTANVEDERREQIKKLPPAVGKK